MRMVRLTGAQVRGAISIPAEGVRATRLSGAAVILLNFLIIIFIISSSRSGLFYDSLFSGFDSLLFPGSALLLLDVGDGLAEAAVKVLDGSPEPVLVVVKVGAGACVAPLCA